MKIHRTRPSLDGSYKERELITLFNIFERECSFLTPLYHSFFAMIKKGKKVKEREREIRDLVAPLLLSPLYLKKIVKSRSSR